MRRANILDELMAEHVQFPGFPQIITTRGFVYQFLKGCGWKPCERGFGSLDYMAFGRKAVDAPLYPDELRDSLLTQVRDSYLRWEQAA